MAVRGAPSDFKPALHKLRHNPRLLKNRQRYGVARMPIFINLCLKTHKGKRKEDEAASFGRGRCLNPLDEAALGRAGKQL